MFINLHLKSIYLLQTGAYTEAIILVGSQKQSSFSISRYGGDSLTLLTALHEYACYSNTVWAPELLRLQTN